MPFIQESYDSLPYIDAEPTAAQRAAAQALIDSELSVDVEPIHPLLPSEPQPILTPILESEYARVAAKEKLNALDLSRYEALEPPQTSPHSDKNHPETLELWRNALKTAYISHEYLAGRTKHLSDLNATGKEEWLAGNEELVGVLKSLEEDLARTKEQIDLMAVTRESQQRAVEGELRVLEESWKKGIARVLETEVAAENLRHQILEARRSGAV